MIHGVGKNQVGGVDSKIEESVDPPPIPSVSTSFHPNNSQHDSFLSDLVGNMEDMKITYKQ